MVLAMDLGRFLQTRSAVRPGHVAKKPLSMAAIQVDGTGEKSARCRYWTRSFCVVIPFTKWAEKVSGARKVARAWDV